MIFLESDVAERLKICKMLLTFGKHYNVQLRQNKVYVQANNRDQFTHIRNKLKPCTTHSIKIRLETLDLRFEQTRRR
jgi:hypothetical protein